MESYFFLAEQFRTQDEPTFCPSFQIMHRVSCAANFPVAAFSKT